MSSAIRRNLLRKCIHSGHWVSQQQQQRKRRHIHNPQLLRAVHPHLRVHDSHRVIGPSHLACARRVENGRRRAADIVQNLLISRGAIARQRLRTDQHRCHGLPGKHLAHVLEANDGDDSVGRVCQPMRVDGRRLCHVGGGNRHVAAGERGDGYEGVVGCVGGSGPRYIERAIYSRSG